MHKNFKIYIGLKDREYMQLAEHSLRESFPIFLLRDDENIINELLEIQPDLAILDYEIPQIDILSLCEKLSGDYPEIKTAIYVSLQDLGIAKKKWRKRALDYIIGYAGVEEFCEDVRKLVRYIIVERQREQLVRNKIELRYVVMRNFQILKEMIDQLSIVHDEAGIERCRNQLDTINEIIEDMTK